MTDSDLELKIAKPGDSILIGWLVLKRDGDRRRTIGIAA